MNFKDRLKDCLIYGVIGDSIGGKYEGTDLNTWNRNFFYLNVNR